MASRHRAGRGSGSPFPWRREGTFEKREEVQAGPVTEWAERLQRYKAKHWKYGLRKAQWGRWSVGGVLCEVFRQEVGRGIWLPGTKTKDRFWLDGLAYMDTHQIPHRVQKWAGIGTRLVMRLDAIAEDYSKWSEWVETDDGDWEERKHGDTGLNHCGRLISAHISSTPCGSCQECSSGSECMFSRPWRRAPGEWTKRFKYRPQKMTAEHVKKLFGVDVE